MFVAIDIGIVNFIYTYYDFKSYSLNSIKKNINKKKINESIIEIVEELFLLNPTIIFIERQLYHARKNYEIMTLLCLGLDFKKLNYKLVNPITRGLKIKNYSERKKYSIQEAYNKIPILKSFLNEISKKDDICDTINILYNELKNIKLKKISIKGF